VIESPRGMILNDARTSMGTKISIIVIVSIATLREKYFLRMVLLERGILRLSSNFE
jgi:hypothetical protein